MHHRGYQRAVRHVRRQLNRNNYVIKPTHVRWRLRHHRASLRIDHHVVVFDANLPQHRRHQRYLVLAISVPVREHLRRRMRLPPSYPQFDRYVTYVLLREPCQRLHFLERRPSRSRQRHHLLLYFRRSIRTPAQQSLVPNSHLLPILEPFVLCGSAGREKRYDHLPCHSRPRRHIVFVPDSFYVAHHPLRLVSRLRHFGFRIVQPRRFVFPSLRKLQRVVRLAHRARLLKEPHVLQNVRLCFLLVFVPNDVSRIGSRDAQHLVLYVRDQFAPLHFRQRYLHRVLVLHFVIFPLRRDAPSPDGGNFFVSIKGNRHDSVIAPTWPQYLVRFAHGGLDLVCRHYRHRLLGIKQHGVRLFVMRRQRRIHQRVHPPWRVRSRSSTASEAHHSECQHCQESRRGPVPSSAPPLRPAATPLAVHLPPSQSGKKPSTLGTPSAAAKECRHLALDSGAMSPCHSPLLTYI